MTSDRNMLHFVFDGPPGPTAGRFVEVETPDGKSVNAGQWHERPDGLWELRVAMQSARPATRPVDDVVEALREAGQALHDAIGNWSPPAQGFLTPALMDAGEKWNAAINAIPTPDEETRND